MFDDSSYRQRLSCLDGRRSFVARLCLAYVRAYVPVERVAASEPKSHPDVALPTISVPSSFWMF